MTDDLISRKAALALCDWYEHEFSECDYAIRKIAEDLRNMPPPEPERGKTRWTITQVSCNGTDLFNFRCLCNKCGLELFVDVVNYGVPNACEHCIEDMRFAIENCVRKER